MREATLYSRIPFHGAKFTLLGTGTTSCLRIDDARTSECNRICKIVTCMKFGTLVAVTKTHWSVRPFTMRGLCIQKASSCAAECYVHHRGYRTVTG
jgi:hypothetical protein